MKYNEYHDLIFKLLGVTLDEAILMNDDEQNNLLDKTMTWYTDENESIACAADYIRDMLSQWKVGRRDNGIYLDED